ncbi:hypothetical protein M5585_18350 [Serratia ureilytica]
MHGNRSQSHEKLSSQQITLFLNFCFNDHANATVFGENSGKFTFRIEKRRRAAIFTAGKTRFSSRAAARRFTARRHNFSPRPFTGGSSAAHDIDSDDSSNTVFR